MAKERYPKGRRSRLHLFRSGAGRLTLLLGPIVCELLCVFRERGEKLNLVVLGADGQNVLGDQFANTRLGTQAVCGCRRDLGDNAECFPLAPFQRVCGLFSKGAIGRIGTIGSRSSSEVLRLADAEPDQHVLRAR